MKKSSVAGLAVMAAASAAVIAIGGPGYDWFQADQLEKAAGGQAVEVKTGEAEGYGGPITAEVTVAGDKILDLKLTGNT